MRIVRGSGLGALLVTIGSVVLGACSSSGAGADAGTATPDQLTCLGPLITHCCGIEGTNEAIPCVATWSDAQQCAAWPTADKTAVFATPCEGLTAIRLTTTDYFTFFVYDATSGDLKIVGDNAAATDPTSADIECGAGPGQYVLPQECRVAWAQTAGSPCGTGPAPATHEWCVGKDASAE